MKASELTEHQLISKMNNHIKHCKAREIKTYLTFKEFAGLFSKYKVCAYSGEEFKSLEEISIERLDPDQPYSKNNCCLVRHTYNTLRSGLDIFLRTKELPEDAKVTMMKAAIKVIQQRSKSTTVTPREAKKPTKPKHNKLDDIWIGSKIGELKIIGLENGIFTAEVFNHAKLSDGARGSCAITSKYITSNGRRFVKTRHKNFVYEIIEDQNNLLSSLIQ